MSDTEGSGDPGKHDDDASPADPIIGEAVGSRLKSLFDEFTSQDVPDRFMDLIGQLERQEEADKGSGNAISDSGADLPKRDSGKADT